MTTDTLSPSATSTSAIPLPSATAHSAHEASRDAYAAADNRTPSVPDPMTVLVQFGPKDGHPYLNPRQNRSSNPSQKGYQFAHGVTDATLIFEIEPGDEHTFSGCKFSDVADGKGGVFPTPQDYSYCIESPSTLVVKLTFARGPVQQIHATLEYNDPQGANSAFDPQIGNDGGNIHVAPHATDDDVSAD